MVFTKKLLAAILIMALAAVSLSGCESESKKDRDDDKDEDHIEQEFNDMQDLFEDYDDEYGDDEDYNDENYDDEDDAAYNSGTITYANAEEVSLDSSYPEDVVPIYPDAKVIGCSMVTGKSSGFVDLLLPPDDFDAAVEFYTESLNITPQIDDNYVMRAAEFKGEIDNFEIVVLVSHLTSSGNDPFIQIIINES